MKILYVLEITTETGFTASDFPDRFEILREDKTPLVFKPVAIQTQEIYSRLDEANQLLKDSECSLISAQSATRSKLKSAINEYFNRYSQ